MVPLPETRNDDRASKKNYVKPDKPESSNPNPNFTEMIKPDETRIRNLSSGRKITSNQTNEKRKKKNSVKSPLEPRQRNGVMVLLPETWNDDRKISSNQTKEKFVKSTPLEPRQRNGFMVPCLKHGTTIEPTSKSGGNLITKSKPN